MKNSLTTALWLNIFGFSLLATQNIQAADKAATNETLFLMTSQLTEIQPLRLQFIRGQQELSHNSRKMIRNWAAQVSRYNIPIFIHSSATLPTGIRNLTKDMARHQAVRIAFNRGLFAKNILEQNGIKESRMVLKAHDMGKAPIGDNITLTIRQD